MFCNHFRIRHWVYLAVGALATAAVLILVFEIEASAPALASFAGAMFVTFGWIVTNEIAIRNAQKQHSINFMIAYMNGVQRISDKKTIQELLPHHTDIINQSIINYADESNEVLRAVDRTLNFFEFLSVGIFSGDINERMAHQSFEALVRYTYAQFEDYILYWQKRDPVYWEHFSRLQEQWQLSPPSITTQKIELT